MEAPTPRLPQFAHYYGDWIWNEELTGWIKSLLLFFDGIALALPSAKADQLIESSPSLAQPLAELGLLRNYGTDKWWTPHKDTLDRHSADLRRRAEIIRQKKAKTDSDRVKFLLTLSDNASIVLEALDIFDAIVEARIKYGIGIERAASQATLQPTFSKQEEDILAEITNMIHKLPFDVNIANARLKARGQYNDKTSYGHALRIRMISTLLRRSITDITIEPVINDESAASFVASMIGSHDAGRAEIVMGDLAQIGIDLSAVPLDEVLDFRSKYGSEYRRYSDDVRKFVLEMSLMDKADRHSALLDRRAELDDRAEQLRKIGRTAFARQAIGFGFGVAGAAWTLVHGDPWGATFAAAAAAAGLTRQDPESIGAGYTYILRAKSELAR